MLLFFNFISCRFTMFLGVYNNKKTPVLSSTGVFKIIKLKSYFATTTFTVLTASFVCILTKYIPAGTAEISIL